MNVFQYFLTKHGEMPAVIADYEEQVLLSCIVRNWCPKCLTNQENLDEDALRRHREHTELIIKELDSRTLWEVYGIDRDIVVCTLSFLFFVTDRGQPFTSEFPRADIQRMLSPDILHQLIKGAFKDHLVDWVEKYLFRVHPKSAAEKILDDIDRRCVA